MFKTRDEGTKCGVIGQTYPTCMERATSMWAGRIIKTGYKINPSYSYYSFGKTLEAMWNMQPLTALDADPWPNVMTDFFLGPCWREEEPQSD